MVAEDNNVAAKKKKLSWLQGEFDQLTNRLMDFIVPRAVEDGGKSLEFADVEMQVTGFDLTSSLGSINLINWEEVDLGTSVTWTEVDRAA